MKDEFDKLLSSKKKSPFIDLSEYSPLSVFDSVSDKAKKILSSRQFESVVNLIDALNYLKITQGGILSVVNDVSPYLGVSHDTVRRHLLLTEKLRIFNKTIIQAPGLAYRFQVWTLVIPNTNELPNPQVKQQPLIKNNDTDVNSILLWAQNVEVPSKEKRILYGELLLEIMYQLLPNKHEKVTQRKLSKKMFLHGMSKPIYGRISTSGENLPDLDDLMIYFAGLKCLLNSMVENFQRNGPDIFSKITYQLPVIRIIEQLDYKGVNGAIRRNIVGAFQRLNNAPIQLSEDQSLLENTDAAFEGIHLISNLSHYYTKNIESVRTTGKGTSVLTFSLPEFIVDRLITEATYITSSNNALGSSKTKNLYSTSFLLDSKFHNLPSKWTKRTIDKFVRFASYVRSFITDESHEISIPWSQVKRDFYDIRDLSVIKKSYLAMAEKRGAIKKGKKLILDSEKLTLILCGDEGVYMQHKSD